MDIVLQYSSSSLQSFWHLIRPSSRDAEAKGMRTSPESRKSALINSIDAVTDSQYTFADDQVRLQMLAKAKRLVAALEKPEEVVFRQAFEVSSPRATLSNHCGRFALLYADMSNVPSHIPTVSAYV